MSIIIIMLHAANIWHCAWLVLHHHVAWGTRPKRVQVVVMAAVVLDGVFCSSVLLLTIDIRDPTLKIKPKGHSETKSFLKFYLLYFSLLLEKTWPSWSEHVLWRLVPWYQHTLCFTSCMGELDFTGKVKEDFFIYLVNLSFLLFEKQQQNNQPTNQHTHTHTHTHTHKTSPSPTTTNQAQNK